MNNKEDLLKALEEWVNKFSKEENAFDAYMVAVDAIATFIKIDDALCKKYNEELMGKDDDIQSLKEVFTKYIDLFKEKLNS